MKIIKLNEEQFTKIFESEDTSAPSFDGGDVKEYLGSEVSTSANVTDANGKKEYGQEPTTDKIAKQLALQNFWASSLRSSQKLHY